MTGTVGVDCTGVGRAAFVTAGRVGVGEEARVASAVKVGGADGIAVTAEAGEEEARDVGVDSGGSVAVTTVTIGTLALNAGVGPGDWHAPRDRTRTARLDKTKCFMPCPP